MKKKTDLEKDKILDDLYIKTLKVSKVILAPAAEEYLIRCNEMESPFFIERGKYNSNPVFWKIDYKR